MTPDLHDHRARPPFTPSPTATPKALRTSSQPGLTRAVSTRLKLCLDPLVYAYDSPGVMLPFIGKGDRGAERGVKLALIGTSPRPDEYDMNILPNAGLDSWHQRRSIRC